MLRRLLDLLDLEPLVRLQELRQLPGKATNDDRRTGLARSYRGDLETFLNDLRREDLLQLLSRDFIVHGRRYAAGRLVSLGRDQLIRTARQLFVNRDVPRDFVEQDFDAFVIEDVEQVDEVEAAVHVESTASEDADETSSVGSEWSRPRSIPAILRTLGLHVPERLRTERFREMMRRLESDGFEVQLPDGTPISADDESPGIAQRLRLRSRATVSGASAAPTPTPPEPVVIAVETRPARSDERNAVFSCTVAPGAPGVAVSADAAGAGAVFRASYSLALGTVADDAKTSLPSMSVRLNVQDAAEATDDVHPSLAATLCVVAALEARRPRPRMVVIGDVSENHDVVAPPNARQELLTAIRLGAHVILAPANAIEDLLGTEGVPETIEILPVTTLADAVAFAFE